MTTPRRLVPHAAAVLLAAGLCSGGLVPPPALGQTQAADAPSMADPVQRVAEVRRLLRSACGLLQDADSDAGGRAALLAEALARTEEAASRWAGVRADSPPGGPGPYAGHPDWTGAATEIAAGIEEMAARIQGGDAASARAACGANCARFTALNEASGLELRPDLLFHFRQAARSLAGPLDEGNAGAVLADIPQLMELVERAAAAPGTGPTDPEEQMEAVARLRDRLAGFTAAVESGREAGAAHASMMESLEAAYDAAL